MCFRITKSLTCKFIEIRINNNEKKITLVDASDDCILGKDMVQPGARPQHVSTKLYNAVSFLRKIHMYMQ